jgi:signal transduction histidine kinase
MLGEAGLTQAVPWLAEGFEQRSGIRVTLDVSSDLGRCRDEVEIAVFRIVQEGLANVLRHSGSPVAKISLHRKASWLELAVSDRGQGPWARVVDAGARQKERYWHQWDA